MKFPYTKFQDHPSPRHTVTILRPVIPVGIRCRGKTLPGLYNVLIDSGADDCIFHAEVGEAVGIDVKVGPAKTYGGVGFGELTGYLHAVEIQVGGQWVECRVAFAYGMRRPHPTFPWMGQGLRYGILGQEGFFDKFKVIFDYSAEEIELRPKTTTIMSAN